MIYEIYTITNKVNGARYIGQTTRGIKIRWAQHKSTSKKGGYYIGQAIRDFGENNFYIYVIAIANDQDTANYLEKFYIKLFNTTENGYNIAAGGVVYGISYESVDEISDEISDEIKIKTARKIREQAQDAMIEKIIQQRQLEG
jgi:group I intron endonuclease